jgi:hypothetical protein
VVLKAFVAGPTETDDSIPYHIIQEESIIASDFVIRHIGVKMNKRERVVRRKHRRRTARAKAS